MKFGFIVLSLISCLCGMSHGSDKITEAIYFIGSILAGGFASIIYKIELITPKTKTDEPEGTK